MSPALGLAANEVNDAGPGPNSNAVGATTAAGAKVKRIVVLSDSDEDEPVLVTSKKVDPKPTTVAPKPTTAEPRAKKVDPKPTGGPVARAPQTHAASTGPAATATPTPKPAQPAKKAAAAPATRPAQPAAAPPIRPAQPVPARPVQPVRARPASPVGAVPAPPPMPSAPASPAPPAASTAAGMQEPLFATEDEEQEQRPPATRTKSGETSTRFGRPIWERDTPTQSGSTQKAAALNDPPANNAPDGNAPATNTPARDYPAVSVRPAARPNAAPPTVRPRVPAADPRINVAATALPKSAPLPVNGDPRRLSGGRSSTPSSFKVPCHLDIKLPGMERRAEMFVTNMTIHPTIPLADVNSLFEDPRPTKMLNVTRIMSLAVVSGILTSRTVVAYAKVDVADGAQLGPENRRMGHFLRELGNASLREGVS